MELCRKKIKALSWVKQLSCEASTDINYLRSSSRVRKSWELGVIVPILQTDALRPREGTGPQSPVTEPLQSGV